MVSPRRGHPLVGGDAFEAAEGEHGGERPDREGDHAVHRRGHDVAGRRVAGPQRHGGNTENGELASS